MICKILFCLFLILVPFRIFSEEPQTQTQSQTVNDYYRMAAEAYEQKNYPAYAQNLKKAIDAGGNHPILYYNLAAAYALLDNKALSVEWLGKLADLGLSFPVDEDENFASIADTPEFKAAVQHFAANRTPTANSQVAFTVPEQDFMAEGLTYDAATDLFYAGSILKAKIISIDKKGTVREFSSPQDKLWSVLGMSVDPKRNQLWVATSAISDLSLFGDNGGKSGIFQYDLKTGKLLGKYFVKDTENAHVLGDVIVDSKGNVYTTDSNTPAIYILRSGSTELETFLGPELFRSPQGLALSGDEKTLFVADYSRGIFAIDIASKAARKLTSPATAVITGIDGLYFHKNSLIATQNGILPNRVLQLIPDPKFEKIETVKILESNHKAFGEPTLGVIVGDWFYYVANNQLGMFLGEDGVELSSPIILKLKLQ